MNERMAYSVREVCCAHELWEREGECADGACPICLRTELDQLRLAAVALREHAVAAERERYAAERKLCEEALAAAIKDTADKVVPMIRQAVAAERERCARLVETLDIPAGVIPRNSQQSFLAGWVQSFAAAAIRKGEE